ncbi:hypothetical protein D8S78_20705 [Natrialba swarupiae]|nr:hypothetical protein [Natrialba swarupiae]
MKRALVLDGRSLSSLAVVRSLGSNGYRIHGGDSFKWNLTSFSKHVDKRLVYPDPEDSLIISLRRLLITSNTRITT